MIAGGMLAREDGQDLPEYALCFTSIALGTVAGMSSIASGVNTVFYSVANILINSTS
jgi:Flp pilus assembly pilin Flp